MVSDARFYDSICLNATNLALDLKLSGRSPTRVHHLWKFFLFQEEANGFPITLPLPHFWFTLCHTNMPPPVPLPLTGGIKCLLIFLYLTAAEAVCALFLILLLFQRSFYNLLFLGCLNFSTES